MTLLQPKKEFCIFNLLLKRQMLIIIVQLIKIIVHIEINGKLILMIFTEKFDIEDLMQFYIKKHEMSFYYFPQNESFNNSLKFFSSIKDMDFFFIKTLVKFFFIYLNDVLSAINL